MAIDHRERLRNIKRFDQLVAYLRDELGWPVDGEDFEDLTFDWEADELGLDMKTAAKIQQIKQLRPLSTNQPWGIFFVKFEKKRLPVVALRRILGKLVIKKRASAQSADMASFAMNDLLFISSYGGEDDRRISLAHFTESDSMGNLPSLRVLGFSEGDRDLKVDHNHNEMRTKLYWPRDESQLDRWRKDWRSAFMLKHREVITTSQQLAVKLAALARDIRKHVNDILEIESDGGPIRKLMAAFREALIHDLEEDDFADMYSQTIAYGLLSARVSRSEGLVADDLVHMIPITNPFLKELMETFLHVGGKKKASAAALDFDELGINEVVELLREANMEAVLRDFDSKNPREDPVIHFYEQFATEYDAEMRKLRGVFYTPKPVVSFIVRSVDEILQTEFGLEDGLADTTTWGEFAKRNKDVEIPDGVSPDDPFVQILDPATGTGTFLVEVIDVIHKTMTDKWRAAGRRDKEIIELWNEYVPAHLLPRLYGFELLMAPYAIAHMKIGLRLAETGYRFGSEERARIYLTNALEPGSETQLAFADWVPALAHEFTAVNRVKRTGGFTAIIGNPPYAGISSNMTPWIDGLLKGTLPDGTPTASFYHVNGKPLGERKLWLQDDYVKFIRWSQHRLTRTGVGVHGYISNHGYIDNPTFRGMRWSLMEAFDDIRVLDLHGNLKKKESPPDGGKDVNVFDIQQGVGIGLFVRRCSHQPGIDATSVRHADLWGEREQKYDWLIDHSMTDTVWKKMPAAEPFFLFEPLDQSEVGDYNDWPAINEIMKVNVTGIVTARDDFVIDFDRTPLRRRMKDLRDKSLSDQAIRDRYFVGKGAKKYPRGDSRGWKLPTARQKLRDDEKWDKRYAPILYRPFDIRQIYYVPWMVDWPRTEAMPHMLAGENLALTVCRQCVGDWQHTCVSKWITDDSMVSNRTRERGYVCPLYLYPNIGKEDGSMFRAWSKSRNGRRANLDEGFVEAIEQATGLSFWLDGQCDPMNQFVPADVLAYIYAVFHCPEYRRRFEAMLKLDFPRVPLPGTSAIFSALVALGHDLIALHLLEGDYEQASWNGKNKPSPLTNAAELLPFVGDGDRQVTKAGEAKKKMANVADGTGRVYINKTQYFDKFPEEVWNFQIGGYQVCHKWLSDRKAKGGKNPRPGRVLSDDDVLHYQRIVVALKETIRLMAEIDQTIEAHGGWPDAFVTEPVDVKAQPEKTPPFE